MVSSTAIFAMAISAANYIGTTAATQAPRAVYFVTGHQPSDSIGAVSVSHDGTLTNSTLTMLGPGGPNIDPVVNTLDSGNEIQLVGDLIFAVNAGSNTVSMFQIDDFNPTKLTRIGAPVTTDEFPIAVAVSPQHNTVCVANAGNSSSGLACAPYSIYAGIGQLDAARSFFTNDAPATGGLFDLVGSVFFDNNEDAVYVTIKGQTGGPYTGLFGAFPVQDGKVSSIFVESHPTETAFLFGASNIPGSSMPGTSKVFASDLTFGSVVISVNPSLIGTTEVRTVIPGQSLTCWVTYSSTTGTGFLSDPGNTRIVEVDLESGEIVKEAGASPHMFDIAAAGDYVYGVAHGNSTVPPAIVVFDISGGRGSIREIQAFPAKGVTTSSAGMVVKW